MGRNRILLTLALAAIGALALGAVLTPEARAATIWGDVYYYDQPETGDTCFVYCEDRNWPAPICDTLLARHEIPPYWDPYYFIDLGTGTYDVWAVYRNAWGTCTSQK